MSTSRDRSRTESAIVDAAIAQLAEGGFQSFGVNTVARRAGCDKQLIYRYFGGLDGLIEAVGLTMAERLQDGLARPERPASYAAMVESLIIGFLDLLVSDPLLRQALAWELAGPSPAATRLSQARGQALGAWLQAVRGNLVPPPGVDAPAINALLIGAVQQLALSVAATGSFVGVATDPGGLARLRSALQTMIAASYGVSPPGHA